MIGGRAGLAVAGRLEIRWMWQRPPKDASEDKPLVLLVLACCVLWVI